MTISNLGFVILFVDNPLYSKAFYSKILNQEPIEESPTFVLFALSNGVMLGLWFKKTAEPTVSLTGGGTEVAFSHENVDATYAQWKSWNIPMVQEPTDMDFGRTFVALDPDGHRVRVYKLHEAI